MQASAFLILAVLASVLVLASVVGFALSASARNPAMISIIENLNTRIRSWWWIVFIAAGAVLAGRAALTALFALASFVALREFLTATVIAASDRRVILFMYLVALPVQYALAGTNQYDLFVGLIPAFGLLVLPILVALTGDTKNYLVRTSELFVALVLCVYCISHVPGLLMLQIPGFKDRNILLIVFLLLVTQVSDVLQYVWGKLLGRHKILPRISPSKTVEGLLGGVASSAALGAGLWWITPFTVLEAGAIAFLLAVTGFLGGLVMSAIKRDRGLKDWSRFIPGHGGMLDRLDSLCLSAPVFFHLMRFLCRC